jgi:peptidoglycan/xylan/chitin deacetylase (PgdA/CDA1 family)
MQSDVCGAFGVLALLIACVAWLLLWTPRRLLRWLESHTNGAVIFSFDPTLTGQRVALTIDDAPSANTPQLLDVLARHGVKATFFCIGERAARYPEILEQIHAAGHEVGNHDRYDRRSSKVAWPQLVADVEWTDAILSQGDAPQKPSLFRPGCGWFTRDMVVRLRTRFGYTTILTDCYSFDAQFSSCTRLIYEHMRRRAQPGSILLLHDGSPSRVGNACTVLERLLPDLLYRRKLAVCTVSELAQVASSSPPVPSIDTHAIVKVQAGTYAFGLSTQVLVSHRFVHCVAIVLRGERGSLLVHSQPVQTTFPAPDEVERAIGRVLCGVVVLGRHAISRGTIHFLATLNVPLPSDAIPYLALDDVDAFSVTYDHLTDTLTVFKHLTQGGDASSKRPLRIALARARE